MTTSSHLAARRTVVDAAATLVTNGVLSHTGHANLSARLGDDAMLLSVEGQVRGLAVDGLAVVGFDGVVREGELDPTNAEIAAMHAEVYRSRPEVGGIIHTHSPYLLAFAMAHRPLACRYEALLRFGQASDVPVVPWAPRGSARSVNGIVDALTTSSTNAVLLGNHGVLVVGAGPRQAAALLTVLEEAAAGEIAALALGGAADLPAGALSDVRAAMARVRGEDDGDGITSRPA